MRSLFLLMPLIALQFHAQAAEPLDGTIAESLIGNYCLDCHSGPEAEARIDLAKLISLSRHTGSTPLESDFKIWKIATQLIADGVMPPADCELPSEKEKSTYADWYKAELAKVTPKPGLGHVRRLAAHEYRNTLQSVFGFDVEVNIMEAEQTVTEKSLVLKLLPTDPPGKSGFTNDTHANPFSNVAWDQYMYITDTVVRELFEPQRASELAKLQGWATRGEITSQSIPQLLKNFLHKARRRSVSDSELKEISKRLNDLEGPELLTALKVEMQAELLSPRFLYRGTLHHPSEPDQHGIAKVDSYELAERLSYFLWADMPDEELMQLAAQGKLRRQLRAQIGRMLNSAQAKSLAQDFGVQWLGLNEINLQVSNNPPQLDALRSQPIDFLNFLFTQERPLLELIDSEVSFVNPHTAKYYGGQIYKHLPKYRKQRGIEVEIVPNAQVELASSFQRGGILTMPGVLAMNRTPIQRGTWLLERILGHELPEPPPNVPAIAPAGPGSESMTFRERFEQHRSQETCAVCHDKIDPLGFAFDNFDAKGKLRGSVSKNSTGDKSEKVGIDTSGQLPSGETFQNATQLKQLLATTERERIVRNIVENTLSYALCRELAVHDVPTVNTITSRMLNSNATWKELFIAVVESLPFQHVRVQ